MPLLPSSSIENAEEWQEMLKNGVQTSLEGSRRKAMVKCGDWETEKDIRIWSCTLQLYGWGKRFRLIRTEQNLVLIFTTRFSKLWSNQISGTKDIGFLCESQQRISILMQSLYMFKQCYRLPSKILIAVIDFKYLYTLPATLTKRKLYEICVLSCQA